MSSSREKTTFSGLAGSAPGPAVRARRSLLGVGASAFLLALTALSLLGFSLAGALSLVHLGLKLPPYQTIEMVGISKPALAGEMADALSQAETLSSADRQRVIWFLEHCGTTILYGPKASAADAPRSVDQMAIINCGNDPERQVQWYRLGNGVLEVTRSGPIYYPQFGDWCVQYRQTVPLSEVGISDVPRPTLRVNYFGLPKGFTLWAEDPRGIQVSYDKALPPWRASMPVLMLLPLGLFSGMAIGSLGLTAWRRGGAHHGGAAVVTLWSAAMMVLWWIAVRDLEPAEAFVDVLQHSRYGVTRLPWVACAAAAGWALTTAYWLHLGALAAETQKDAAATGG